MVRIFLLGSMKKTERMVKAMPLESTLVASWWSILAEQSQHLFFFCLLAFGSI